MVTIVYAEGGGLVTNWTLANIDAKKFFYSLRPFDYFIDLSIKIRAKYFCFHKCFICFANQCFDFGDRYLQIARGVHLKLNTQNGQCH